MMRTMFPFPTVTVLAGTCFSNPRSVRIDRL